MFRYLINLFAVMLITLMLFATPLKAQDDLESPNPSTTTDIKKVSSYELFWPISAGVVLGERTYTLKTFKENLRELFIFNDSKKSEYNVSLSTKRVVETEKLLMQKKDYKNASLSLDAAQEKREKARDLLKKVEEKGKAAADLKKMMISALEGQRTLLSYLSTQIPEEQKEKIDKSIAQINSVLSTLQ